MTVTSRILREHGGKGATPALFGNPESEKCTTVSNTARIVDSNRRHRSQGVCGGMPVGPRRTFRRPNCGIRQTEKQDSRKGMGLKETMVSSLMGQ